MFRSVTPQLLWWWCCRPTAHIAARPAHAAGDLATFRSRADQQSAASFIISTSFRFSQSVAATLAGARSAARAL